MTTIERAGDVSGLLDQAPSVRAGLMVGPVVYRGPSTVHIALDRETRKYYEFPVKLGWVLDRLDGKRTLREIGAEFAEEFGTRLDEQGWIRILTQLGSRGLLTGGPAAAAPELPPARKSSVLAGKFAVRRPGEFLDRLHRGLGWLLHPEVVAGTFVLFAILLITIAVDLGDLFTETAALLHHPLFAVGVLLVLWGSVAGHELAHGVAARHFGAEVLEIGVVWRLPAFFPYCRVEGVSCVRSRWQRSATAFAGAHANLLVLLLVTPIWLATPTGSAINDAAAGMLLVGGFAALVNLLPLPGWDGYRILGYLTGTADLAGDSRRYWSAPDRSAYPRRLRLVYRAYPLLAVLSGVLLAGCVGFGVWRLI
ncbi:MAG TPA: M50 family metallopeptidase [Pseudonocardiaceae bacterium]|jgi:putative peptide zinc metalloprotease protein